MQTGRWIRDMRTVASWARRGLVVFVVFSLGCATTTVKPHPGRSYSQTGEASYYGHQFHGRKTASGAVYDENKLTAAHRDLPFGTRVRVTNLANKRSVVVTINDRGPFVRGRIIDLSHRAAADLGFLKAGVTKVLVESVD